MPRDIEMQYAPTIVADDEKAIEQIKCDRWDCKEIHRGDHFPVITQKREPAPTPHGVSWRAAHLAGDRSLADIETQHQ
jgi:hypothetical protein